MLTRLAEHARIVSAVPNDTFITQRTAAVKDLVQRTLAGEVLAAFAEIALFGFPHVLSKAHSQAAQQMYEAIHAHQPSFVNDMEAMQMDLRLVASVALGELLSSNGADPVLLYVAALLQSAMALVPAPGEVHLAKLVNNLMAVGEQALLKQCEAVRVRPSLDASAVSDADVQTQLDALINNLRADREELDVLWWVFGGRSARTGARFDSLPDGERAITAATELSDRMLMPPIKTASYMLTSTVPDGEELTIIQLVGQLSKQSLEAYMSDREQEWAPNPALLPITWLSDRLLQSDLSPGWEHEFGKKARLAATARFPASRWASQLFVERVARKLGATAKRQMETIE